MEIWRNPPPYLIDFYNPIPFRVNHFTQFCRIKGRGGTGRPLHQTFLNGKTDESKLCITLKGIYGRFRISLNNCEFTKFRDFGSDFASWSQKSRSVKLVKISKFCFDKIL